MTRIQTGGTIVPNVSLYIKRQEDQDFIDAALEPKAWINIYGCRTMGKSSLYTEHLSFFTSEGFKNAVVDVASDVGHHPQTGFEWVRMLGRAIASKLDIDSQLVLQPLKDLVDAGTGMVLVRMIEEGVLKHCKGKVLLILDEYDYIRELNYCDDILFALRNLQNNQANSDRLNKLTVCLTGLRPVSHLGEPGAANTSPVCTAIQMQDFKDDSNTLETLGLPFPIDECPDTAAFRFLYRLTGGQPLITMELLRRMKKYGCRTPAAVKNMAEELVANSGQGSDLQIFTAMEDAIIAKKEAGYAALHVYESLLQGNAEAHTAPGKDLLLLFGFVRQRDGYLEVKGDLFQRRFDRLWAQRAREQALRAIEDFRGIPKDTEEQLPNVSVPRRITKTIAINKNSDKKLCVINAGGTLGMVQRGTDVVAPRDEDEYKNYFTWV